MVTFIGCEETGNIGRGLSPRHVQSVDEYSWTVERGSLRVAVISAPFPVDEGGD